MSANEIDSGNTGLNASSSLPGLSTDSNYGLIEQPYNNALANPLRGLPQHGDKILNSDLNPAIATGESGAEAQGNVSHSNLASPYGDEFESGIPPIDQAARIAGKALDLVDQAIEQSTPVIARAIDQSANHLTEIVRKAASTAQEEWSAPDNRIRPTLMEWRQRVMGLAKHQIDRLSEHPKFKSAAESAAELGRNLTEHSSAWIQTVQSATENWIDQLYSETYGSRRLTAFDNPIVTLGTDNAAEATPLQPTAPEQPTLAASLHANGTIENEPSVPATSDDIKPAQPLSLNTAEHSADDRHHRSQKRRNATLKEYQRLQKQENVLEQQRRSLENRLERLTQHQQGRSERLTRLQASHAELTEQLTSLEQQRTEARSAYEEVRNRLEENKALTPYDTVKRNVQHLIDEQHAIVSDAEKSQAEKDAASGLIGRWNALLASLPKDMAQLDAQIAAAEQELAQLLAGHSPIYSPQQQPPFLSPSVHIRAMGNQASPSGWMVSRPELILAPLHNPEPAQALSLRQRIETLKETRALYLAATDALQKERDGLITEAALKHNTLETVDQNVRQKKAAIGELDHSLNTIQTDITAAESALNSVKDGLTGVQLQTDVVQQNIRSLLERKGDRLPDTEQQLAIERLINHLNQQLITSTDPEKNADLENQISIWNAKAIALQNPDQANQSRRDRLTAQLQNIVQTLQSKPSLDSDDFYQEVQNTLQMLIRSVAGELREGNAISGELAQRRDQQSHQVDRLAAQLKKKLLPAYAANELADDDLQTSITVFNTLSLVQDQLMWIVKNYQHDMAGLKVDIEQNAELQATLAEIKARYLDPAQILEDQMAGMYSQAVERSERSHQELRSARSEYEKCQRLAEAADQHAQYYEELAAAAKQRSIDERTRLGWQEDPTQSWEESGSQWRVKKEGRVRGSGSVYWYPVGPTRFDVHWGEWKFNTEQADASRKSATHHRAEAAAHQQRIETWEAQDARWRVTRKIADDVKASFAHLKQMLSTDIALEQEQAEAANHLLQQMTAILPQLAQRLTQAQQELQVAQNQAQADWTTYDASSTAYDRAATKALNALSRWDDRTLDHQFHLENVGDWIAQHNTTLADRHGWITTLRTALRDRLQAIDAQLEKSEGDEQRTLNTQKTQLQQSLQLVTSGLDVLDAQQVSLTNLEDLENAHREVNLSEQRLMQDYLTNPDREGQVLTQQLQNSRELLAEAQRLADLAETSSETLIAPIQTVTNEVLAQDSKYVQAATQQQDVIKRLLEATTAAQKTAEQALAAQQGLSALTTQINSALVEAAAQGDREAAHLLQVAKNQTEADKALALAREYKDLLIKNKKPYRSLIKEYEAITTAQSGPPNPETQHYLDDLANRIVDALRKAVGTNAGKGDDEARTHLITIEQNGGILQAARNVEILEDHEWADANEKRKHAYGTLLLQYQDGAVHYQELRSQAEQYAEDARLARLAAEATLADLSQQQQNTQDEVNRLGAQLETEQANVAQLQQTLHGAQLRLQGIAQMRQQTEQILQLLLKANSVNLLQAQLPQQLALERQADLQQALLKKFDADTLARHYQRSQTVAQIEQLEQHQTELDLQNALNQLSPELSMGSLKVVDAQPQHQQQMAGLLDTLRDLEHNQPELSENLQALIGEVQAELTIALAGQEAGTIQDHLTQLIEELSVQNQTYHDAIAKIDAENQRDLELLGLAEQAGALQQLEETLNQLMAETERSGDLLQRMEELNLEYQLSHVRIDQAEQTIEDTEALSQYTHQVLSAVIDHRIQARSAAKTKWWQYLLQGVTVVVAAVGTVLTYGGAAPALGAALSATSAVIGATSAALNGDVFDAIFNGVLGVVSAVTGGLGQIGRISAPTLTTIQKIQQATESAVQGIQAFIKNDNILGALAILESFASATSIRLEDAINSLTHLSEPAKQFFQGTLESFRHLPQQLHHAVKAIQTEDWLAAVNYLFNTTIGLGQTFLTKFDDVIKTLSRIDQVGNTALIISRALKNKEVVDLNAIAQLWRSDLQEQTKKTKLNSIKSSAESFLDEDRFDAETQAFAQRIFNQVTKLNLSAEEKLTYLSQQLKSLSPKKAAAVIVELPAIEDQADVIQTLPKKQQEDLVANLPKAVKEHWLRELLVDSISAADSRNNARAERSLDSDYGAIAIVNSPRRQNALEFLAGAFAGEFNRDPSIGQILLDAAVGMIPGIGEVGDIRDLTAISKRFKDNPAELKNPYNWLGVTGSLIGLVPVVGGAFKGLLETIQTTSLKNLFQSPATRNLVKENIRLEKRLLEEPKLQNVRIDFEHIFDRHGLNRRTPGKTEFTWEDDQAIDHILDVLYDEGSKWIERVKRNKNGEIIFPIRWNVIGEREGVEILVSIEPTGKGIITAFPQKKDRVELPRNPHPPTADESD